MNAAPLELELVLVRGALPAGVLDGVGGDWASEPEQPASVDDDDELL